MFNRKSVLIALSAVLAMSCLGFMTGSNVLGTNIYMAGFFRAAEGSAPTCASGFDFLWGDSTAHREKVCDNNGSAVQLVHSGADINASDQVTGWNGGAAPASATVVGTNGSSQPVSASTEGNGSKVQLTSAGATTSGHATSYDGNGNVQDSGKALPSGTIVGTSDTQALTGKTLTGASSGNTVTVPSGGCTPQSNASAITGNSSAQNIFTCTLPASTVATGKGVHIRAAWTHSTGTASIAYQLLLNGQVLNNPGTSATGPVVLDTTIVSAGSTTGSYGGCIWSIASVAGCAASTLSSLAWSSNQTISITFNVGSSDQVTPIMMVVDIVQ